MTTRRRDVLHAGIIAGWEHDDATFDGGSVIRDRFTKLGVGELWVLWIHTPWSDQRFAGAVYRDEPGRRAMNVYTLGQSTEGKHRRSVLDFLRGTWSDRAPASDERHDARAVL